MPARHMLAAGLAAWLLALPAGSKAFDVDQRLEAIDTLTGEFVQEVRDSRGALRERAEGEFALAKPGRFRWIYRVPAEQWLVSDGKTLWLYDVDLEQVTRRALGETLSATPLALLAGQASISETHRIEQLGSRDGLERVRLVPKAGDAEFIEVLLMFRGPLPAAMEFGDRLGQRTVIRFSGLAINPAIAPETFRFEPPVGVDVIGLGGN